MIAERTIKLKPFKNISVVSGSSYPRLAEDTARYMSMHLTPVERKVFSNTERYVRYEESIRGQHIFIIQSLTATETASINDYLIELILMIDAARRASASLITVVIPYLAYSRQDRKARGREPISAAAIVQMIKNTGADRIVSVDMHSAQIQAAFNGPFDHLIAEALIHEALEKEMIDSGRGSYVVVSPDTGGSKNAELYANKLGIDAIVMTKKRERKNSGNITHQAHVSGVENKKCLIVDDMIDTAGTLVSAAKILKKSGAEKIISCATHGIFSDPAIDRIKESPMDKLLIVDTLPLDRVRKSLGRRLETIPIAPLLGKALSHIAQNKSISEMFHDRNYK